MNDLQAFGILIGFTIWFLWIALVYIMCCIEDWKKARSNKKEVK